MSQEDSTLPAVAFIAKGELFVLKEGESARAVNSAFMMEAEKREAKQQAINGWKESSSMWSGGLMNPQLAQFQNAGAQQKKMFFNNVAGGGGRLAYSLQMPGGGGLFRYDCQKNMETRLFHRNSFFPTALSGRPGDGLLAFSVVQPDGSSSIVIGERDGLHHRRITAGDSRDECPTWWNDGQVDWLYFHSTGLGRNSSGIVLGIGPAAICRIRLTEGDVEIVAEDPKFDYLQPRVGSDGSIFCIRRPYMNNRQPNSDFVTILKDIVCFPYRLARTVFYFTNFMSVMFSGKPLASGVAAPNQAEQLERLVLWGRVVDTQKSIRLLSGKGQNTAPADWQLVKIAKTGDTPEVIVSGVLCFDLASDGRLYYSDGSELVSWSAGQATQLTKQSGIIQVAAIS